MNPAAAALELNDVTKDFSIGVRGVKLRALEGLSLRVEAGQVYGLLGPNGSGKSTALKLLLGLLEPTAGDCSIFGQPSNSLPARRNVGYLPESPFFHRHLSGREMVSFHGRLCGLGGDELAQRVVGILELVGMADAADRLVGTYSKGMLQRIGLAQALVHNPRVLILDEPTAGVDPAGAMMICELILKLRSLAKTILITSHLLAQLEGICDAVGIIDRGRLVFSGAVAEFCGSDVRRAVIVDSLSEADLGDLDRWLASRGRMLLGVTSPESQLERIYLEHVGRRNDL